ncbi:hypothetical protein QAD02_009237 [Eretmocerus hayati]|uniref:Uncharacterized protein n=1 Tax=Eretmocerus hayati TaxID=131215 RepID=A0ACC2N946_9HYME|nr:hypothetical protein QAD02_009237 [Eretmocerus hayati]
MSRTRLKVIATSPILLLLLIFGDITLAELELYPSADGERRLHPASASSPDSDVVLERLMRFLEAESLQHQAEKQQHKIERQNQQQLQRRHYEEISRERELLSHQKHLRELARQKERGLFRDDLPERPDSVDALRESPEPLDYVRELDRQKLLPYLEYEPPAGMLPRSYSPEDELRARLQLSSDPQLDYPETQYEDDNGAAAAAERRRQLELQVAEVAARVAEELRQRQELQRQKEPEFTYRFDPIPARPPGAPRPPFAVAPNDPLYYQGDDDEPIQRSRMHQTAIQPREEDDAEKMSRIEKTLSSSLSAHQNQRSNPNEEMMESRTTLEAVSQPKQQQYHQNWDDQRQQHHHQKHQNQQNQGEQLEQYHQQHETPQQNQRNQQVHQQLQQQQQQQHKASVIEVNMLPEPVRRAHINSDPVAVSIKRHKSDDDLYFIAIVAGCSAATMFALVLVSLTWCRLQRVSKAAADVEYPAYGVTGPNKDISPSGDQRLAQSAQMYHFQHQKQQIIAMENRASNPRDPGSVSEAESDEENEEGDYTVYECPGLAPAGEMEVKNPLFHDDPTPATPKSKKDDD